MWWPAAIRALQVVPPGSLEEVRTTRHTLALRCTLPGCTECAEFETEGRETFERTRLPSGAVVVPWDCSSFHHRELAAQAGVDQLPAYVIVPPRPQPIYTVRP